MISRLEVFVATLGSDGSSIDPAASGSATVGRLSAAVIEALTGFQEDVLSVFVPVAEHYGASVQVLQVLIIRSSRSEMHFVDLFVPLFALT
jgi:hypothetical protein